MYSAPDLQFIGMANEVVRGVIYAGGDVYGQLENEPQEFERD